MKWNRMMIKRIIVIEAGVFVILVVACIVMAVTNTRSQTTEVETLETTMTDVADEHVFLATEPVMATTMATTAETTTESETITTTEETEVLPVLSGDSISSEEMGTYTMAYRASDVDATNMNINNIDKADQDAVAVELRNMLYQFLQYSGSTASSGARTLTYETSNHLVQSDDGESYTLTPQQVDGNTVYTTYTGWKNDSTSESYVFERMDLNDGTSRVAVVEEVTAFSMNLETTENELTEGETEEKSVEIESEEADGDGTSFFFEEHELINYTVASTNGLSYTDTDRAIYLYREEINGRFYSILYQNGAVTFYFEDEVVSDDDGTIVYYAYKINSVLFKDK